MQDEKIFLTLSHRRLLKIYCVKEILSFEADKVFLYTEYGDVKILGINLEVEQAFGESGQVTVSGYITSIVFGDNKEKLADNFIAKLFR